MRNDVFSVLYMYMLARKLRGKREGCIIDADAGFTMHLGTYACTWYVSMRKRLGVVQERDRGRERVGEL